MKMTDEYIRRHTRRAKGPTYNSKRDRRYTPYRVARIGYAIVMCAASLLLVGLGIHDRMEKQKAQKEKLYWEEYYAKRKHEPVDLYQYYKKEEKKPYDPQADPLSPYYTAPAYRTGSNNPGNTKKNYTPYKQGYWDGYDEGYDDRIQGMGYGYKYDCDGESYEYQKGYAKGYREGFREAWEENDAFGEE